MSNSRTSVDTKGLIEKINKVIGLYKESLKTVLRQKEELSILKQEIQDIKSENQKLQDRLKNSMLATALETNEGNTEAIAKINRLMREIDSCIALLNR